MITNLHDLKEVIKCDGNISKRDCKFVIAAISKLETDIRHRIKKLKCGKSYTKCEQCPYFDDCVEARRIGELELTLGYEDGVK